MTIDNIKFLYRQLLLNFIFRVTRSAKKNLGGLVLLYAPNTQKLTPDFHMEGL